MSKRRQVQIFTSKNGGPIEVGNKPNRNSKCYCGSEKKYKHCHWNEEQKIIGKYK